MQKTVSGFVTGNQLDMFPPVAFDRKESERRKQKGMKSAADHFAEQLQLARRLAIAIARANPERETNADAVGQALAKQGLNDCLGPAAGSIFKGNEWEFTGKFVKSARVSNHSRLLRVWRLR